MDPKIPSPVEKHKFNDDLLLTQEDQNQAAKRYPTIVHVLDHPELRELFAEYDEPANRAKCTARTTGLCAIGLLLFALAIAASEHLFEQGHATLRMVLALLSALCGISGVVIGGVGVLHAQKKRTWLYNRLMAERIRQFHFQTFVFRLPDILESLQSDASKAVFKLNRSAWLEAFKAAYSHRLDSEFTNTVEDENGGSIWLHEVTRGRAKIAESEQSEPLFKAYRELRIMHQIGYANYKLQNDRKLFSGAPRTQAAVLSTIGLVAIILVCAIHVFVLLGAVFAGTARTHFADGVSVLTIWIALIALAIRAAEEGLQPEREIERYQQYRSALRAILERFDVAPSQAAKVRVMQEMERLSFDEMRNFLITNDRARFVM